MTEIASGGASGRPSVGADRINEWRERFRFYRDPPTAEKIKAWLRLFGDDDVEVAAKVLDHVIVVGERDIQQGYRQALHGIEGWSNDVSKRKGRWFFVGFGGPGESGSAMLRMFREANDMANAEHHPLFVTLTDLPALKLTAHDHVVFVDDFSGTGRQITKMWPTVSELVASEAACHLILTAATVTAQDAIQSRTALKLSVMMTLGSDSLVFHEENKTFSDVEKSIIESYCKVADHRSPRGYGGLGALFVLSHKTPNNALPILHINEDRWRGLFPRYLRAA